MGGEAAQSVDADRTVDIAPQTLLASLASLARAATGAVERTEFLPNAARQVALLLDADVCEIWIDEEGPVLAATFRVPSAGPDPAPSADLEEALAGAPIESDDWRYWPVPSRSEPIAVLAMAKESGWTAGDDDLGAIAAALVGLALQAMAQGFDAAERDRFLALVGHDLRSPLANVRVGAQLAVRNLEAGDLDSVKAALGIIENQSGRLVERLEALLEAVAAQGGQLIRLEALDLAALAESVVDAYRLSAEEQQTGTSYEVSEQKGVSRARGDAGQIGQVLEQLVDNATKYASGGEVRLTVGPEGDMVRVDVCDDGPGIRPEDVDRVFAPFGRGQAAAGREGFGLGLYLARNIISAHGGRLWISRTSRSGTCMSFTLPVARQEDL